MLALTAKKEKKDYEPPRVLPAGSSRAGKSALFLYSFLSHQNALLCNDREERGVRRSVRKFAHPN